MKKLGAFRAPKGEPRKTSGPRDEAAARAFAREPKESRKRRLDPTERIVAYVPPDVAEDLRVAAVRQRRSLSDAVTEAVKAWLAAQRAT